MTFDEAVRKLEREEDLPGEWVEGWYCSSTDGIRVSQWSAPNNCLWSDQEALDYVKARAKEGSPIHQAALHVHILCKLHYRAVE